MNGNMVRAFLSIFLLLVCSGVSQAQERIRYFINDPSGSPVQVLDADGAVVARYAYAPFGSQVAAQGAANQRLGFVGGTKETASLHYLKHRYYNPLLGRFYQPDPVGFLERGRSQINRYGYGLNDPYTYQDKDGRQFNQLSDEMLASMRMSDSSLLPYVWLREAFSGVISTEDNKQLNNEFLKSYVEGQQSFIKSGGLLMLLTLGGEFAGLGPASRLPGFGGDILAGGGAASAETIFKTAHYASRLETAGVSISQAEAAVGREVAAMRGSMATNTDIIGRLTIDGVKVEYRARLLPNGVVNVGTLFPVK